MSAEVGSVAGLAGVVLGERQIEYTERDAALYALAVGAHADDLDLVFEKRLRVLPTFGLALGLWAVEAAGDLGVYDRLRSLHAAQTLITRAPLHPAGTLHMTARVDAVWDKGKAALIDIVAHCDQFTATYSIFLPGAGGWGGERGPSAAPGPDVDGETMEIAEPTSPDAAALYRLTGDLHPVHIDPEVAARYGFPRPILHGLCTLGIAARAVAAAVGAHPCDLAELAARFAAPVLPGNTLTMRAAARGNVVSFDAKADGTVVLSAGRARFRSR